MSDIFAITADNYQKLHPVFTRCRINPIQFIASLSKEKQVYVHDRTICDINGNVLLKAYRNISPEDKQLIESSRLESDAHLILEQIDQIEPIDVRRKRGRFFTKSELSEYVAEIVRRYVNPDYIIEPFVGSGSLITPFKDIGGIYNDIESACKDALMSHFSPIWKGDAIDFIKMHTLEIFKRWNIPKGLPNLLILSNPPFGTSGTNKLASRSGEGKSRSTLIEYGELWEKYGRGDIIIPAIGRMIECIIQYESGYLGFFSQSGIFCERTRYMKLLRHLLRNFEFLYGEIFDGSAFDNVSKEKSIAFTLWKYKRNANTNIERITFKYKGNDISFKRTLLLKDCWEYNNLDRSHHEIVAPRNDTFNNPNAKLIGIADTVGSEMVPSNVKRKFDIDVPNELFYGLWSTIVGYKSITKIPVWIDAAYIHIPQFSDDIYKILAYTILFHVITERYNNYTDGKIGFIDGIFVFGNQKLTASARALIQKYSDLRIGEKTIGSIFKDISSISSPNDLDKKLRIHIRKEIQLLIDKIEYYKYIPLPMQKQKSSKTVFSYLS